MTMNDLKKSHRERLVEQKAKLDAKIKQLDAREKILKRKRDTRKKIILGGLVMSHMDIDANFKAAMEQLIDRFVTRENDRPLFDLPPIEQNDNAPEKKSGSD